MLERRGPVVIGLLLSAALIVSVWIVDYIPSHDGPNHIVHGYLDAYLGVSAKGYDQFLEPRMTFSNLGFMLPFSNLVRWLPWQTALRLTECFGALLWAWSFTALCASVRPERLALGALGFATALSWSFYMGFFPYWLTSGMALAVVAYAVRQPAWGWRERAVLGVGVLLVALCHVFVAEVLGLVLAILVFARPSGQGRLRDLLSLFVVALPSLAIAVLTGRGSTDAFEVDYGVDPLAATWLSVGDTLLLPWKTFTTGPAWRGLPPALLALAGLGALVWRRRRAEGHEIALGAAALILALLGAVLPFHLEVWKFLSPRFLPFWVAIGIVLIPLELVPARRRMVLGGLLAAFALASIGWSGWYHVLLARAEADALTGAVQPLRRNGARLPIKLTHPASDIVAHSEPGLNVGQLYVLEQGGMTPYLFATRENIHPHVFKRPRDQLFPPFPGRFYHHRFWAAGSSPEYPPEPVQLTWLALLGSTYQDVILIAEPAHLDAFVERGYLPDYRHGKAAVLRYQGCGLDVRIDQSEPPEVPVVVEYGWAPILETAAGLVFPPGARLPEGGLVARFAEAPCGPIWARVTWDRDGSGSPTPGDSHCRAADPRGRLYATSTRGQHTLSCQPP